MLKTKSEYSTKRLLLNLIVPSLLFLAFSIPGLTSLKPTVDARIFYDRESTEFNKVEDLEAEFTTNNTISFIITTVQGDIFDKTTLDIVHALSEELWSKGRVKKVDSVTNFKRTLAEDDSISTDTLYNPDTLVDFNELKEYVRSETRLIHQIVGKDLDITAVIATLDMDNSNRDHVTEVISWAELMAEEISTKHANIDIFLAGPVVYSQALTNATSTEFSTKIPIIFLFMVIILFVILRSITLVIATVYIIFVTNAITMAIAGWLNVPLTPISAFVPIALFAIVLADAVHLITGYIYHVNKGDLKTIAIQKSLDENFKPMFITSLTTTIGFLCLNLSESPPFQHLGNLAAVGSIIAFLLTVLWLPRWILLLPIKATENKKPFTPFLWALKKPVLSITIVAISVLLLTSQLHKNYLDDKADSFFDDTWEIKRNGKIMNDKLGGVHRIEYRVSGFDNVTITDPIYLTALSDFGAWALTQPIVAHVTSFDQVIKTVSQQMNNGDRAEYRIPNNKELISQFLLLYELSLPYGATLDYVLNFDKTATRLKVVLYSASSQEMLDFEQNAKSWMQTNWPAKMVVDAISLETIFSRLNINNSKSMIISTTLGFILIAVLLCFILKSWKLGLLSMVSNALPALTAFGVWGIKDGQIGLAVSVVSALTLGIVVDDTIHLLSKYQRAKTDLGYNSRKAAQYALETTGKALLTTTVVLVVCFGVLVFSHFKPNADLGFLCALTLGIALVIDLFLFLPLVMILGEIGERSKRVA